MVFMAIQTTSWHFMLLYHASDNIATATEGRDWTEQHGAGSAPLLPRLPLYLQTKM